MQIYETEQVETFFKDVEEFFENLDSAKKNLETEISKKENEQDDYLHELELAKLNGIEIMKVANNLTKTRKERRVLKDTLDFVKTLKGYADKYITKGIIADTKQALKNIENLKNLHSTREYTPKVVKELKCARRIGK